MAEEREDELHGVDRLRAVRIEKAEALRSRGVNPYPYRFETTHAVAALLGNEAVLAQAQTVVRVAGRILALRGHGKTLFGHVEDSSGGIQFYVRRDEIGDEVFTRVETMDLTDTPVRRARCWARS